MSLFAQILIFSILSGVLSLIGGVILLGRAGWVRRFSIHFISFAAGVLLAASFLDLLPEAIEAGEEALESLLLAVLIGIAAFFIIERLILKFHRHSFEDDAQHAHATPQLLLVGDGLHNFVDGVIVASAFLAGGASLGVVTALAVAAHELPQEISDFSIMLHHGWSKASVFWWNFLVSLTNVAGAIIAFLARGFIEPYLPLILAFTAGIFIYISSSDLLPEIPKEKTSHVIILFLLGIASVWILGYYFGV